MFFCGTGGLVLTWFLWLLGLCGATWVLVVVTRSALVLVERAGFLVQEAGVFGERISFGQ